MSPVQDALSTRQPLPPESSSDWSAGGDLWLFLSDLWDKDAVMIDEDGTDP